MLPFLMGVVFPALLMLAVAFVLRPKDGVEPPNHNQKFQSHIYVSKTWEPAKKKIEPYKYQTREEPANPTPIFDELEVLMRESEARLQAAIKASTILQELGSQAKKQLQLV